ncbi:unnamed protein product [Lactuca virosa]|uniref:Uncharacterized protein n=1 Tax=Lactuca virosa TaxID=75947 RepID=A0AAU9NGN4_9ASTR|nr:unnamed protein product [Lactuca virosa]
MMVVFGEIVVPEGDWQWSTIAGGGGTIDGKRREEKRRERENSWVSMVEEGTHLNREMVEIFPNSSKSENQ